MAKTKSSELPRYELLYIISNKFSEDEVAPIVEKIKKLISDSNGTIALTEDWGKKHLAYPIKGFSYGYYNLVEFDMDGASMTKVDRTLRMSSDVLRHQIIKKSSKEEVRTLTKINAEKPAVKEVKPKKEKPKEKEKEKTDLKDLDEKLDKILETNDLL